MRKILIKFYGILFLCLTPAVFAEAPQCGNQWGGTAEPMGCLRSVEPAGSKSLVKNNTTSTTSNFVYDVTLSNFDSRTKGASVFVVDTTANQTYRPLYDASDWNTDALKTQAENLCENLIKNGCNSGSTGISGVTGYSPSTYTFATASSPSQAQAKFNNVSVNQSNKSFILGCYDVCDCGVGPGVTQESPDKKPYVLAEKLSSGNYMCQNASLCSTYSSVTAHISGLGINIPISNNFPPGLASVVNSTLTTIVQSGLTFTSQGSSCWSNGETISSGPQTHTENGKTYNWDATVTGGTWIPNGSFGDYLAFQYTSNGGDIGWLKIGVRLKLNINGSWYAAGGATIIGKSPALQYCTPLNFQLICDGLDALWACDPTGAISTTYNP